MNRHEHLYRRTGRILMVLLGLWVLAMLLAWVLPAGLWKWYLMHFIFFDGVVPVLFLALFVVSVLRVAAYVRWTGKYPYYFLFSGSRRMDEAPDEGQTGVGSYGRDRRDDGRGADGAH